MTLQRLEILDPTDTTVDWWSSSLGLKSVSAVNFVPGLNVLFAPNGYGKSTVLHTIANLTHSFQGGPPVFTTTSLRPWFGGRGKGARLVRDKGPCFYADPANRPGLVGGMAGFDDDFMTDGIIAARANISSGEWCTYTINRIVGLVHTVTDYEDRTNMGMERLRKDPRFLAWQATQEVVTGNNQPTVLLDEFDRSLDIAAAAHMWSVLARVVAKKVQIVVAGHSPFVLQLAAAGLCNLIDLCPGYAKSCGDSLELFSATLRAPHLPIHPMPFEWKPRPAPVVPKPKASRTAR